MSQINDLILEKTGGPTINDGLSSWFSQTASETLNDAEYRWLSVDKAQPVGTINDMWFSFLRASGFTGALIDMLFQYWGAPSIFSLPLSSIGADGTFVRATGATVKDHESVIRKTLSGELRFQGQRRVENLMLTSEVFSDYSAAGSISYTSTSPTGGPSGGSYSEVDFGAGSANDTFTKTITGFDGSSVTSIWVRTAAGTDSIRVRDGASTSPDISITTAWKRLSFGSSVGVGNAARGLQQNAAGTTGIVYIAQIQAQDKNGASDPTIPDDYVSTGVLTTPYHGAVVDGVKYFLTTNGNTVLSNVVTAGVGAAITDAIGNFLEIGRTNKGTCFNAIPNSGAFAPTSVATFNANTTNLIAKDNSFGATFGVVTDAVELALAGLDGLCVGGLVYKIIAGGIGTAQIDIVGSVGNTNPHAMSAWARVTAGSGQVLLSGTGGAAAINTAGYNRFSFSATPAGTGNVLRIRAAANSTVYFILPQLEEGAFITSEIVTEGATVTRNKDDLTYPTTSLPANDMVFDFDWTPTAALQGATSLLGSYLDANNDVVTYMNSSTNMFVRKKVAGALFEANKSLTYVAGTTYSIKGRYDSVLGVDIWIDDVKGVNIADTSDLAFGSSLNIGYYHSGSGLWQTGGINNFKIHFGNFSDAQVVAL